MSDVVKSWETEKRAIECVIRDPGVTNVRALISRGDALAERVRGLEDAALSLLEWRAGYDKEPLFNEALEHAIEKTRQALEGGK